MNGKKKGGEVALALDKLTEQLSQILPIATKYAAESLEEFSGGKVGCMWAMMDNYYQAYTGMGAKTRTDFEDVIGKSFSDAKVQQSFEELLELETEWDSFLIEQDKKLHSQQAATCLSVGDPAPLENSLADARTGEVTSLQQILSNCGEQLVVVLLRHFSWLPWRDHVRDILSHKGAFDSAGGRVVVVSFGERKGALGWLEQMEPMPLDLLLDAKRELYLSIGLQTSLAKTWSISALTYYTEQVCAGRTLPTPMENVDDDPNQMGGDFIVGNNGSMVYTHPSQTPSDRPSVEKLIQMLSKST